MSKELANAGECRIARGESPEFPDSVSLYDGEGDVIFVVDSSWTDRQIWQALRFANRSYQIGYNAGESMKATEIRRALDIC